MRKNEKGKVGLVLICFAVFILTVIFFINRSNLLKVKSVDVQTDKVACASSDQLKASSNLSGQNIIFINSAKIKSNIKNKFLCVRDIQISRNFSELLQNKITLNVSGRIPKALLLQLKVNEATQSSLENVATPSAWEQVLDKFVVDDEGIIFAKATNESGIPKIYIHDKNSPISNALKILEKVQDFKIAFEESEILDDAFIIYPKGANPRIIFRLGNDLDIQLASLQLILGQAKIDGKDLEFIDLRFDKPIVKFAPKKN